MVCVGAISRTRTPINTSSGDIGQAPDQDSSEIARELWQKYAGGAHSTAGAFTLVQTDKFEDETMGTDGARGMNPQILVVEFRGVKGQYGGS